eukprot:s500_g10.t1
MRNQTKSLVRFCRGGVAQHRDLHDACQLRTWTEDQFWRIHWLRRINKVGCHHSVPDQDLLRLPLNERCRAKSAAMNLLGLY